MTRTVARFAVLPVLAVALAAAALPAQQYPAEPGDGVADMAGIIPPALADSVRGMLAALRTDASVEVRVLTVRNIARYGTGDATPEAFATAVYNDWKLGIGQAQDGVLVMVSVEDRFARIELGDGAPLYQDARMQSIMDTEMVPRFRHGDYGAGIMEGVRAVAASYRAPGSPAVPLPAGGFGGVPDAGGTPSSGTGTGGWAFALVAGAVALVLGGLGLSSYQRHRKRDCAGCGAPMQRLDEAAGDVHLDSGRRLEEVLGSVDYDVWQCTGCSNHQVLPYPALFSGNAACPSCRYKTVVVTTTVLERPTYDHAGRQRVEKDCRHCGWRDEDVVHLPRRQRPSSGSGHSLYGSSSGSGGGSSGGGWKGGGGGGGSSSGRGASGRW